MQHVSATLMHMIEEFDAALDDSFKALTADDEDVDDEAPSVTDVAAARAVIRTMRDDAQLTARFMTCAPNPYAEEAQLTVDIYADSNGTEYWIDRANDRLIHAGPRTGSDQVASATGSGERRSVAELRAVAMSHVVRAVPDFMARRSSLHPLEDNVRRDLYFFRWDDFSRPLGESDMPPFVQVAVHADGRFSSFTDTLTRPVTLTTEEAERT